jgi:N utilization substance protein A
MHMAAKKKMTKVVDKAEELARRGRELIRAAEVLHREKNISLDAIYGGIEKAIRLAINKAYGEEEEAEVDVTIDRATGLIEARRDGKILDPEELGRIYAQAAKQMMIQNFREEESTAVFNEYQAMKGDLVHGIIQRFEGGAALVSLGRSEALLPRGEQIPGEAHHVEERVKAVILEVKKSGHRVKIILSRTHPDFVRRLFENEIPEIKEGTISIKAVAREAGYRSKVAVSSIDLKVDCVGACVGVRGSRIKNIVEELNNERIDIVRWNDSLHVLIPNALQPAVIEEVFLYPRLGRAIVLVQEDQLSLAIGRRGQNVRLASKLVGWDIEIMTHDELNTGIERAENWFSQIPGVTPELVEAFIEEGFLSYDDLTFLEPAELGELAGISEDQAEEIIAFAEDAAEQVEREAARRIAEQAAAPPPAAVAPGPGEAPPAARDTFENLFRTEPEAGEAEGAEAAQTPVEAASPGEEPGVEVSEEAPQPTEAGVEAEAGAEAGVEQVEHVPPEGEAGGQPEEVTPTAMVEASQVEEVQAGGPEEATLAPAPETRVAEEHVTAGAEAGEELESPAGEGESAEEVSPSPGAWEGEGDRGPLAEESGEEEKPPPV